jgi:hypothetical protein
LKQCSWCNTYFSASVSYQIYCSSGCRDDATKEKIVERHKATRRHKRNSKTRMCAGKCGTKLSLYNDYDYCGSCYINNKEVNKKIKQIRMLFHDYENNTES